MHDELWKFNYRAQLFHDFIGNMDAVWQDSAAKTIRQRYITPHTEDDQHLRQALNDQVTNHEQAYQQALQVEELVIKADEFAQTIRKMIEDINQNLKTAYSHLKFADQQTNETLKHVDQVLQLINQVGGCCGATEGPSFDAALFSSSPKKAAKPPKVIAQKTIISAKSSKRLKRINPEILGFTRIRYLKIMHRKQYDKLRNRISKKLSKNLVKANISKPKYSYAAHHIVPFGEDDLYAKQARLHLEKFGIDINDAHNGVFLPTRSGIGRLPNHRKIHTTRYYDYIWQRLLHTTTQAEVITALNKIREDLINGKFPY